MKSFKQFCEEFRGEGEEGIFKNPTPNELKQLKKSVRGWVDKNGDFYVANKIKGSASLHDTIMSIGFDLYYSKFTRTLAVTLQRIGDTNSFALGELEPYTNPDSLDSKNPARITRIKKIKTWLKKARTKNRGIVFILKNIWEISGHSSSKDFFERGLSEDIKVPVGPGDWILGGKFKNKKIKIKTVSTNEKGDILINGRPMMKFRIPDAETQKRLKADEK